MRHQRSGKKLGRDSAHRRALYANLASELIEHERIQTTLAKAKAVRPIAEQMITLGRRGDIHARRQAVAFLGSKDIVHKLFAELGPRYAERPGGYARIIRIGPRAGDAAEMVYLELVDTPLVFKSKLAQAEPEREAAGEEEEAEPAAAEAEQAGAGGEEPEQPQEPADAAAEAAQAEEPAAAEAAEETPEASAEPQPAAEDGPAAEREGTPEPPAPGGA